VSLISAISSAPVPVIATGAVLAVLVLAFIGVFLIPAAIHWRRLLKLRRALSQCAANSPLADFKAVFATDATLTHLWKEYEDSLHLQKQERDGQLVTVAVRATVPAEVYFNNQFVVDSRLRIEFFKHLPGLFTGVGIIGTFSGLIDGLRAFQLSDNAATVRISLEALMHSVSEAFLISATAITAAMAVTLLEKMLLSSLYRKTEEIAQDIDARFDSGAGEEYLSRLVKSSEESASQAKMLKDSLVSELGDLLRELTNAQVSASREQQEHIAQRLTETTQLQVEAARADNKELGTVIAESIQSSLYGPMQDLANTVKAASGDQSVSTGRMLQDVMTSFSQRLNDLFGGQIAGLSDLNQQTAKGIQDAVSTLQALVTNIEESSKRSTESMAERMAQAIERMESRQEAMNAQSQAFVDQIRGLVSASQTETSAKLQATLETLGAQVSQTLATLSESQKEVFESNRSREQSMADRAKSSVGAMSESVSGAVKEMSAATAQMAQSVAALTSTTTSSIDKMNAGAEQLSLASRNFASAGDRVSNVLGQAANVTTKLVETSAALSAGGTAIQDLLKDYRSQRDAVGTLVTELKAIVQLASKEASLTKDVLARIEASSERLGVAQKKADEYLTGVSRVLGEAHTTFASEVKRTLNTANTEFHTKLTSAVGMLSSAVQELEVSLAGLSTAAPTRR
jgi:ABC-type transporter Mla subunit MlaD